MTARTTVLPITPLVEAVQHLDNADAAALCGVHEKTVGRWRNGHTTTITAPDADRLAIRMGLHPSAIWGEAWWQLPTPAERKASARALAKASA